MASIKKANDNNLLGWYKVKGDYTVDQLLSQGLPNEESPFVIEAPVLVIASSTGSEVVLVWSDDDSAETWTIQRSTDGVTYSDLQTGLTSPTATDSTVTGRNLYYYRVVGFTSISKASRYSNIKSIYVSGFVDDFNPTAQIGANNLQGVCLSVDGLKMYLSDNLSNIFEYDLTSGLVATSVYASNTYNLTFDSSNDLFIGDDGDKFRVLGSDHNSLTLSTAYDISTASFITGLSIPFVSGTKLSFCYANNGVDFYVLTNAALYQLSTSVPYDRGASPSSSIDVETLIGDINVRGVAISDDGKYLYIGAVTLAQLVTFELSTPYDIQTASIINRLDISPETASSYSLAFYDNSVFISDAGNKIINQYDTVIIT